jgi:hypothetical protein
MGLLLDHRLREVDDLGERTVAPQFISPQNVSSSVPVMPQSYRSQGFVTSPAESNLSAPDAPA